MFISLLDARVFASMFSKLSSKLYRNVLVERLSSHIDTEPGEKFTWLINHTASDKSLKERCSDMRRLSIEKGEQTAQIIVVNDFYDCLATMHRYKNHLGAHSNDFNMKLAELENMLADAKQRWKEKFDTLQNLERAPRPKRKMPTESQAANKARKVSRE